MKNNHRNARPIFRRRAPVPGRSNPANPAASDSAHGNAVSPCLPPEPTARLNPSVPPPAPRERAASWSAAALRRFSPTCPSTPISPLTSRTSILAPTPRRCPRLLTPFPPNSEVGMRKLGKCPAWPPVGDTKLGAICARWLQTQRARSATPYHARARANLRSVGREVLCPTPHGLTRKCGTSAWRFPRPAADDASLHVGTMVSRRSAHGVGMGARQVFSISGPTSAFGLNHPCPVFAGQKNPLLSAPITAPTCPRNL